MGGLLTLILDDGEDILECLKLFVTEQDIRYGTVIKGKGAIKDFEIIAHGQRGSLEKVSHKREYEVNALSGKLEIRSGNPVIKVNALLSSSGFTPLTGELVSGKAAGKLEIGITKTDLKKMIEA